MNPWKSFTILAALLTCTCAIAADSSSRCEALLRSRRWAITAPENARTRDLVSAAQVGDFTRIRQAIREGGDLNGSDGFDTPLVGATKLGRARIVQFLIQLGASVVQEDPYRRTALSWAAQMGSPEIIRLLIDAGAKLNSHDPSGDGPLHYAAGRGHFGVVRQLLALGEQVDSRGLRGRTPLMEAALMKNLEIARFLLQAGADPNIETVDGRSALGSAMFGRSSSLIALLLHFGAHPTARERASGSSTQGTAGSGLEYSKDYYAVLGVPSAVDAEELKRAYRKQALRHHPDRNPGDIQSEDLFKKIAEAFEVLKNPAKRAAYDLRRKKT